MADLVLAAHKFAGLEDVRYPYCLTLPAEITGCNIRMDTKENQPSVFTHPFSKGPEDLKIPRSIKLIIDRFKFPELET
jgi:[methyl-Co(III) methanol-specific corrinoid protein]:coenzyme M methyltransferase